MHTLQKKNGLGEEPLLISFALRASARSLGFLMGYRNKVKTEESLQIITKNYNKKLSAYNQVTEKKLKPALGDV